MKFNLIKYIILLFIIIPDLQSYDDINLLPLSEYNYIYKKNITRLYICNKLKPFRIQLLTDLQLKDKGRFYSNLLNNDFTMYNYFTDFYISERENLTIYQFNLIWDHIFPVLPELIKAVQTGSESKCNSKRLNNTNIESFYYHITKKNISYSMNLIFHYKEEKWKIYRIDISEIN
jgi:hypothetical protein